MIKPQRSYTLSGKGVKSLKQNGKSILPEKVEGDVFVANNPLESLDGCPHEIGNDFSVANTNITSLAGGPKKVGSDYVASKTGITNLEGIAQHIGWALYLRDCKNLKDLKGIDKHVKFIGAGLLLDDTNITSHMLGIFRIKGLKSVSMSDTKIRQLVNSILDRLNDNDPERKSADMLLDAQEELIENGYEDLAKL